MALGLVSRSKRKVGALTPVAKTTQTSGLELPLYLENEMREQHRRMTMSATELMFERGRGLSPLMGDASFSNRSNYIPDKPTTDMLQAMVMPAASANSRVALAEEVEDLLGYTPLRKDAGAASRLQRLLSQLDITPYDPATVKSYKDKMQAHFQAIADAKDQETEVRQMQRFRRENQGLNGLNGWFGFSRTEVSWSLTALSDYTKPVPEFVLRKCLEIKRHAPDAHFFVDELRENKRTLDPFLWVTLRAPSERVNLDECAAIEVWDEPEFEKTL